MTTSFKYLVVAGRTTDSWTWNIVGIFDSIQDARKRLESATLDLPIPTMILQVTAMGEPNE